MYYPPPRTREQQKEMRYFATKQKLEAIKSKHSKDSDYFTRSYYWSVEWKGSFISPPLINFHPQLWEGTRAEFDEIRVLHFDGKEDEFKIIDTHKFATYEDHKNNVNEINETI